MHIQYTASIGMLSLCLSVSAQNTTREPRDSLRVLLPEVNISESHVRKQQLRNALQVDVAGEDFLRRNFSGNLIQSLNKMPGVQSMDIGSGFSKPMIRGLGFNRISFVENGIKQEGQQWGTDHGLETDPFNAEEVMISKGPSALLYGGNAIGGIIETKNPIPPAENMLFGELIFYGKSVNDAFGGSFMTAVRKDRWFSKIRYSEQHFADFRVPTDRVVYLTRVIPIYNCRLKNTAGYERDASFMTQYIQNRYKITYNISNVYQKSGFFPGTHGLPDTGRVKDDGDNRNIELPFSKVNHFKTSLHQQYLWEHLKVEWNIGYQNNHREEWSEFHTHYPTQPIPESDPNKELVFDLDTYSSTIQLKTTGNDQWEYSASWDIQYQQNRIGGYSFLLPEYNQFTTGGAILANWKARKTLTISGGLRYDLGRINIKGSTDPYLAAFLHNAGYEESIVQEYMQRSRTVNRTFHDYSLSLGAIWHPFRELLLKANIGRSFRLPGANELAANGMHHGTFRHEQGDATMDSEKGWQADFSACYESGRFLVQVSPFISWFENYIYLNPTGKWSILPHSGQIYRYTGSRATFMGGEISLDVRLINHLHYEFNGEYVHTYNRDKRTALSFSPPMTCSNILAWRGKRINAQVEYQFINAQHRIAQNEDETPGASLFHASVDFILPIAGQRINIVLSAQNILNKRYYNHLSFYRKIEVPEPGRSFQLFIKIPFKTKLK